MGADGRYGVGMRWLALTPVPSLARERGDQGPTLGRPDAAEAALAQIFCQPLNPLEEGTARLPQRGEVGRGARHR